MFRPQFPFPSPPPGFIWQPCIFRFDKTNTPAFVGVSLATGQESGYIPLPLDQDAPFILMAIKVGHTNVNVQILDPYGNELMDTYVDPAEYASDTVPPTILEGPGIECPKGGRFQVRLQGQ
jgi:hypothetical protein